MYQTNKFVMDIYAYTDVYVYIYIYIHIYVCISLKIRLPTLFYLSKIVIYRYNDLKAWLPAGVVCWTRNNLRRGHVILMTGYHKMPSQTEIWDDPSDQVSLDMGDLAETYNPITSERKHACLTQSTFFVGSCSWQRSIMKPIGKQVII